ncbi:MAG: hypothetical protein JXA89_06345 [Anaerolineae bacterium]|nr:hypothetical protein [Anaerolineae bacterium]
MTHKNLQRHIPAGETVKPWLILGPFYQDLSPFVQGLTLFEKAGATVGRSALIEIIDEAEEILKSTPYEGQEISWRGMSSRWSLVRKPEKYLSWGQYNISNHLGAAFLSTIVTPDQAGVRQLFLVTRITSRIIVMVNGTTVFDITAQPDTRGPFEYTLLADLKAGENVVTIGMFRLGRMAQIGCRLQVTDGDVQTRISLDKSTGLPDRAQVEAELGSLSLPRDVFYPEHPIGVKLGIPPQGNLRIRLLDDEKIIQEAMPTISGMVALCQGDQVPDGTYQIESTWLDGTMRPVTSVCYEIHKHTPRPAPQGYDMLQERKRLVLGHYAQNKERRGIWTQVARYALGRYDELDEGAIRETCEFIAARKDCADFVIQGLLRLMYWDRERNRLSSAMQAMMKDTVLGFKYWVDEPGDTVMYMGSENHRLLFHVAEWMAGQLFPTEEFTNSRQRGLYHATKGRMYITEWLRQRGRFGFDEWHSNSYYPISIAPIVNVYDFAIHEDDKLRQMAGSVLDYAFFNLAADSLDGIFGTTHGRSYGIYVKYPDFEGTSAINWLLYGTGSLTKGTSGMAPVTIATSEYTLPKILADIATDDRAVIESKIRQGVLRGTAPSANFCVYRTPDYLISGLQDHRKGQYESSTHVAQVTLHNKVVIFWSCPHTTGEGSGLRPDYWSGHTTLPRVIQHHNVMSLTWRPEQHAPERAWMTHCFFEQERIDQVVFVDAKVEGGNNGLGDGRWAFARVNKGYVGIYSQHGFRLGDDGQYAGRELVCDVTTDGNSENSWLVECGREADYGSFDAFVDALKTAKIEFVRGNVAYQSPSIGRFVTGWDVTPTVEGEPIQLDRYPLVDSPWAYSKFGSGELEIRYGDQVYEIWFNQ